MPFQSTGDVSILLAYRRLFDWLPSQIFQIVRLDAVGAWKKTWPDQGGESAEEKLFPHIWRNWTGLIRPRRYTTDAMGISNGVLPIRLHNLLHNDQDETTEESVFTKFVCKAMVDAPKTCLAARQADVADQAQKGSKSWWRRW